MTSHHVHAPGSPLTRKLMEEQNHKFHKERSWFDASTCIILHTARHALTRRLSVVVDDWMEEVALVCFNRVTSHSVLTQYVITVEDNKITIISD